MFKNFFKIAFRNTLRNKVYSLINVLGLAIGICCCILLMLYINHETSYEKYYQNADDIYRVWLRETLNGKVSESAITTLPYGPDLKAEFPEVLEMARVRTMQGGYFSKDEKQFGGHFLYADNSFLEIFGFETIYGDITRALAEPGSLVLTKSLATKLFAEESPVGKTVLLNNSKHLMVTAVIADQPQNTHLQFSALLSLEDCRFQYYGYDGNYSFYTYLLLAPNADPVNLQAKFPAFMEEKINKRSREFGYQEDAFVQNITEMHLYSGLGYEMSPAGSLSNIYVYSLIAVFVLFIACVNFMNLSIAGSLKRAKEIGVRKVVGASRGSIVKQHLGESLLFAFIALVVALILVEICLPPYNRFLGLELQFYLASEWKLLLILPLIIIVVGVLSGAYPAFYLSRFNPGKVLKSGGRVSYNKSILRNVLVVLQFVISTVLIVCTVIIYNQISFMNNKDMGYNKENVLIVSLNNAVQRNSLQVLKNEVEQISGVRGVSSLSALPVHGITMNGYVPEGYEKPVMLHELWVDEEFKKTFEVEIVEGRNFSKTDKESVNCIINQAAVESLGWTHAIGKKLHRNSVDYKVVGVVKDFHITSLHDKIAPVILKSKAEHSFIGIKLSSGNLKNDIEMISSVWKNILPGETINYRMFSSYYDGMYRKESRFGTTFITFSLLAIFIACLGLFGLSSYMAEQRTREIGIRKVLGANTTNVFTLLSSNYFKLLLIANLIAAPIAWFGMDKWLEGFAYRIPLPWWPFVAALLISIVLMFITITVQTMKSAKSKPVDAIKYE